MRIDKFILLVFLFSSSIFSTQGGQYKPDDEIFFYKDEQNNVVGISRKIIVKFKPNADKEAILKDLELIRERELSLDMMIVLSKNPIQTLEICKTLQNTEGVEFAHPDFLKQKKPRSIEPLYNELWHLENNGQFGGVIGADIGIKEAWKITKGNDSKIAIIDGGFDLNHEDLKDAVIAQKDFDNNDNNASYDNTHEYHGTICAGIALARENGKGVVGVAPKSSLIAIKTMGKELDGDVKFVSDSQYIDSLLWADEQGADAISCSWGTYDVSLAVKSTIEGLIANGRGGKGMPIFFAVGNDGMGQNSWINDEAAIDGVIAIGSSTDQNQRASYSNFGSKLDFVTPSGNGFISGPGIASTDISGELGYSALFPSSHPDYTYASDSSGFHGTSASTPMAAATVALMLSINPELTKTQIETILRDTADKIGYTSYVNGRNDYYGYGKINANKAVKEAKELSSFIQILPIKSTNWSMFSLKSNQTIYDIKGSLGENIWRIYGWDSLKSNWKIWASDRTCDQIVSAGYECLTQIEPSEGFLAANYGSSADSQIYIKGGRVNEKTPTLQKGWNLVGFGSDKTLLQLKTLYGNSIFVFAMENGNYLQIIQDSQTIESGSGCWIYNN